MRITAIPLQSRTHRLSHFLTRSEAGCHAQHQQDHISSAVFYSRRIVMLAVMALTSIGGCRAATKKAAHVDPRLENVRLRLRLVGRQWRNCPYLSGVFFNPMSATRPSMYLQSNPDCGDSKHYSCSDRIFWIFVCTPVAVGPEVYDFPTDGE